MRAVVSALVLAAAIGAASTARAQADYPGARALGMGEAMRAVATGGEAPFLNPAGMSLIRQYEIEGEYGLNIENLGHHAHVSIVDSITTRVAAGLFYTYIFSSPKAGFDWAGGRVNTAELTRTGHAAGLSLSLPLGGRFLLGATIKYLHLDTTAPLPKGTVPQQLTLDTVNGITFDVGLIVKLGDKFRLAATGQNLWDHGSSESPILLGFAAAVLPVPSLTITFDGVVNFTGFKTVHIDPMLGTITAGRVAGRLGPGLEWLISGKVPLRVGVVYDSGLPATYLTAGVGYVSSSFGVDLGYRAKVAGGIENFLLLGIRLFIN